MALQGNVKLTRCFLSLASDPSVYISCGTAGAIGGGSSKTEQVTMTGEFRQYANNVVRLYTSPNTIATDTLALRALTPGQVKLLRTMVGRTCLFRDTYGRRWWCSFLAPQLSDIPLTGDANRGLLTDVGIELTQITYTEGV